MRDLIAQLPDGEHKAAILAALDADAAEAEKAATISDPLAVALKAPENISSVSIDGHEYAVNEHGLIEIAIEDAHRVAIALEHGFQRAVKAVRNLL